MAYAHQTWRVVEELSRVAHPTLPDFFYDYIVITSPDGEVARVPNSQASEQTISDRCRDTARLIAAAPDLLLACRLLCALEDEDVNAADTRWKQVRKDMRAAITRATGIK